MHPGVRTIGVIAATIVAFAIALPFYVYVASEARIERRYPLPTTGEPAAEPKKISRGAHLALITGCGDCHAENFEGRLLRTGAGWTLWTSNLRIAATEMSDGEFALGLQYGLAPDATSLWNMPSASYHYMGPNDVAALAGYLRSLGLAGWRRPRPHWSMRERFMLIQGRIMPSSLEVHDAPNSLDLGPRYDGGRYLARIACSECHSTDLGGGPAAPDLDVVSHYDRTEFFDLLRRGIGARGQRVAAMQRLAPKRFRGLADYEITALFDYLQGRATAPPDLIARARANEIRRRARSAAEEQD